MDVPDEMMLALLEARDGPLPERSWPHESDDSCRYSELYDGESCPWCEAVRCRQEAEASKQQ